MEYIGNRSSGCRQQFAAVGTSYFVTISSIQSARRFIVKEIDLVFAGIDPALASEFGGIITFSP